MVAIYSCNLLRGSLELDSEEKREGCILSETHWNLKSEETEDHKPLRRVIKYLFETHWD
jgi:hypothetical protein